MTGAGSGIGRATALAFARPRRRGFHGRRLGTRPTREIARRDRRAGGQALAARVRRDTQPSDVQAALGRTVEAFGRLDFAFNNAGIEQPPAPTRRHRPRMNGSGSIDVDLRGVFLCMKYEIPLILAAGRRRNRQHLIGRRGHRHHGAAAYGAAKHGVIGLTKSRRTGLRSARTSASTRSAPASSTPR